MKPTKPWQPFGRDTILSKLESFMGNYPNLMAFVRTVASVAAVGLLIYLNA
jgi:hypothetical protein